MAQTKNQIMKICKDLNAETEGVFGNLDAD